MNKLYIDPKGIIKVIDVPEEPSKPGPMDHQEFVEEYYEDDLPLYYADLEAAKEAGIEVADQEQATAIIWQDRTGLPLPNNQIYFKRDTVHNLPEGWRVEIKNECPIWCSDCKAFDWSTCKERKVAVLLPPVSEKVESQEDHIPDSGKMAQVVVNTGALEAILKEKDKRIAELEKENSDLRAQLGRVKKGELRLEAVKKRILSKLLNAGYAKDGPAYKIIEEEIKVNSYENA